MFFNAPKTIILAALCSVQSVYAQQNKFDQDSLMLDELVVTASKVPVKQSQTGKVLTILRAEELEKNQGKSLTELLNQQTGITIVGSQNTMGSNQEIYLRGAAEGYTLVLLNGQPIYDPSNISNSFDLNLISIDQIERIEILKGGQSTLYGSDAMAGVINIITKKGSAKRLATNFGLAAGSYGTLKANAGLTGSSGNTSYGLQYGYTSAAGFSSAVDKTNSKDFDKDGFSSNNLNLHINTQVNKNLSFNGLASINATKAGLDEGAFTDGKNYFLNSHNLVLGIGSKYDLAKGTIHVNYNSNTINRAFSQDSSPVSKNYVQATYQGISNYIEAYGNFNVSKKLDLLVGVDNRSQKMYSDYFSVGVYGPYEAPTLEKDKTNSNLFSAFSSLTVKNAGKMGAEIGARYNQHSIYGYNSTFTLNPYLFLNKRLKAFINLNSAFKAPTQYQLFSEYGTADLRPTTSITYELGSQVFSKDQKSYFRAVAFMNKSKDVIIFESSFEPPYGKYVNFDKQNNRGVELDGQYKISRWNISGNFTFIKGEVSTKFGKKDTTYANLFRRPTRSLNVNVGYQMTNRWNTQLSFKAVNKASSGPYDPVDVALGDYTLINFYTDYLIKTKIKVYLDLKNIGNVTFFDVPGFNSRKFNFMSGLLFNF